jgi:putative phage-type endonuclease
MSLSPERAGRLTASTFASAIGIGYDSRQKLWRRLTGREEAFQGNEATQWGSDNEVNAIMDYEAATGEIVLSAGNRQQFVIHPDYYWLGCTPDGFVGQDIVVEAKCPASMNLYGKVPEHYMPQIQGQMAITGRNIAHFICWTPEGLEVHEVLRDQAYWDQCLQELAEFWQHVQTDTEPKRRKKPTLPTVEYVRIV